MPSLHFREFPLGWIPCDDDKTGRKGGLLRADNLTQDENGIWRLIRGTKKVSSGAIAATVNEIYSRYINSKKYRYVSANGAVYRNYGALNTLTDFDSGTLTGGDATYATFGTGFGHNFIISGSKRRKDNTINTDNAGGTNPSFELGIGAPGAPNLTPNDPYNLDVSGKNGSGFFALWSLVEGSGETKSGDYYLAISSATTFRMIAIRGVAPDTLALDAKTLTANYKGYDSDIFKINVRIGDTATFIKCSVEYLLETPTTTSTVEDIKNYYIKEWVFRTERSKEGTQYDPASADLTPRDATPDELSRLGRQDTSPSRFGTLKYSTEFRQGIDVWTTLTCQRGDFRRVGTDDSLDWGTVKGIRVTFTGIESQTYVFNDLTFEGGPLSGYFTYKQVNVYDSGEYQEFGIPSTDSAEKAVINAAVKVACVPIVSGSQINRIHLYRRSEFTGGFYRVKELTDVLTGNGADSGSDLVIDGSNNKKVTSATHTFVTADIGSIVTIYSGTGFTPGDYIIESISGSAAIFTAACGTVGSTGGVWASGPYFTDTMMDAEALQLNLQLPAYATLLPDYIYGMVCDYFGRNIYITAREVIPSYKDNPGLYDSRFTIDIGADDAEFNLFIAKVSNSSLLLGTTKDIYEISGDGSEIQILDGSIILDFKVRALGVFAPPVSSAFSVYDSALIYLAHDGWHRLIGSSNEVFSSELSLLYKKETRHGINEVIVPIAESSVVNCVVAKDKFWGCVDHVTIGRALHVFNFKTKTWEFRRFDSYGENPQAIFAEEDGTLLYSTTSAGDKYLREYDVGTLYDEATNINFLFRTIYSDDDRPRNRKDLFTLRGFLDTGNTNVSVIIRAIDDTSTVYSKTYTEAFNGFVNKSLDINTYISTPVKRIQIEISGSVPSLKIGELFVDYDARPEQLNFLIIKPSNFGVAGRKRVPIIPMVIDTLGNNVTFAPVIDAIYKTASVINTNTKAPHIHYFNPAEVGYMVGGVLSQGLFEFYELVPPREIEVLPDPVKYKFTNYSNLGSSARKRMVQYARMVDTKGNNVTMTPYVDGTAYPSITINSSRKKTHIYTFASNVEGVDVACELAGVSEFEDWGENLEECITEKLPRVTKFVNLSTTNWGIANKKRIRTIPFVINTRGGNVEYVPTVDGATYDSSNFNSTEKRTFLHYFTIDSFGIDYGGYLHSPTEFEFYEMLKPEIVQILPVAKKFDQLGPFEFNKVGKIKDIRLRLVPEGNSIEYNIYSADTSILSGSFSVTQNIENVYTLRLPRGVNPTICRVTLLSTSPFHRLGAELKLQLDGRIPEYVYVNENGEAL